MTLALYGKTRRRRAGLLLAGLMAVVIAIGGGLFLRNNDEASALTLGSASGTWTAHVGSPTGFSGEGTNRIYWGSGDSGQSSYRWLSGPAVTFTAGQSFLLGDFTHYNNPIDSSITSATLSLPLAFTDPAITRNLSVVFAHDETPNGADPCAYAGANGQGVNINGCADRVQLPTLGADQHFQVGDNLYTLVFTGFHPIDAGTACPAEDPGVGEVTTFLTREQAENKGCVYAQLTFVAPVVDVAKEAVAATINVGEDAKFKITVTNASEAVATGWSLTDTLPAGFTWSMESGPAACGVSAGVLSCTDMTIPAGTVSVPGKVEIVVKASTDGAACGPIVNPLVTITKGALTESAVPVTISVINCDRTLRIVKVTDTATHPGGSFEGTIQPFGGSLEQWSASLVANTSPSVAVTKTISTAEYQLIETTLPTNWTNAGYLVIGDPSGTATCTGTFNPGSSAGIPSGPVDYLVCIRNTYTPPTRTIEVCKVVVDNNDGTIDGGTFAFDLRWGGAAHGRITITSSLEGDATSDCTTFEAPVDATVIITEAAGRPGSSGAFPGSWNGDDPLYPQNSIDVPGTKDNSVDLPVGVSTVTFYNKTLPRTKLVVIEKYYQNLGSYIPDAGDLPTFTLSPDPFDGVGVYTVVTDHCTLDAAGTKWTCTVPAAWIGTAAEALPLPLGWRASEGSCDSTNNPVGAQHFAFCNEPYGTIRIQKFDSVNGSTGPLWDFTIGGNFAAPGGAPYTNPAQADQGTDFVSLPIGLSNTPITVSEVAARSIEQCATANTYYTIVSPPADTVINSPDDSPVWTFQNVPCGVLGSGGLIIEKYLDINGDGDANDAGEGPLSDWTFTTTGSDIAAGDQVHQTDANGQILGYTGFDAGTVLTTTESVQAGYTLRRVTLDGANVGINASNDVVIVGGETRIIRYYNQPLGSINVHKNAYFRIDNINTPAPDDDDGWTITVTSALCGISPSKQTDTAGNASFTNLPLCTDYVVSENTVNPLSVGFTPASASSFSNQTPGLNSPLPITFNNEKVSTTPPCTNCGSTPTPTIPTATPTTRPEEPTNTPVPPTATPTQTGIVAGEKTPGPASPTPIVPSTGNGVDRGANLNLAFIIVGLFAVTTGLGAFALRTNRRR